MNKIALSVIVGVICFAVGIGVTLGFISFKSTQTTFLTPTSQPTVVFGKLGKLAPKVSPKTLYFSKYFKKATAVPTSVDWSDNITQWNMYLNSDIGDCTCAGMGHMLMCWSRNADGNFVPTDNDVLTAYEKLSGYDPNTGQNDNGVVELDVLKYWQNIGLANHKIIYYVSVDTSNIQNVKAAINTFEGLYIGVALPKTAQSQEIWDVSLIGQFTDDGKPGSWGGHCVNVVGFDKNYVYVVTWGQIKKMTWAFWEKYVDEAYAIISPDMFEGKVTPLGFDMEQMRKDLRELDN